MWLVDSLVVIGLSTVSLGTIQEADGVNEHSFQVCNAGTEKVVLHQGYTSCGCTTIDFAVGQTLEAGDTTTVTLRFNPKGKGGEFLESGTIRYGDQRSYLQMALSGYCVTSEETLMRQFPIRINEHLRISVDRFDLGILHAGEKKERNVVVLHQEDDNRQESIPIVFSPDAKTTKGLNHVQYPVSVMSKGKKIQFVITLDFLFR